MIVLPCLCRSQSGGRIKYRSSLETKRRIAVAKSSLRSSLWVALCENPDGVWPEALDGWYTDSNATSLVEEMGRVEGGWYDSSPCEWERQCSDVEQMLCDMKDMCGRSAEGVWKRSPVATEPHAWDTNLLMGHDEGGQVGLIGETQEDVEEEEEEEGKEEGPSVGVELLDEGRVGELLEDEGEEWEREEWERSRSDIRRLEEEVDSTLKALKAMPQNDNGAASGEDHESDEVEAEVEAEVDGGSDKRLIGEGVSESKVGNQVYAIAEDGTPIDQTSARLDYENYDDYDYDSD